MPEGGPETKPEAKPQGEVKPEGKPESRPEEHVEQAKGRYVKYQDLSKDELVSMLMRINKRLSRISRELREVTDILYYGYTQGGAQGSQGQGEGQYQRYRRNYGYKRNGGRRYSQRRNEEDVNYE